MCIGNIHGVRRPGSLKILVWKERYLGLGKVRIVEHHSAPSSLKILVWKERYLGLGKVRIVEHHSAPNTALSLRYQPILLGVVHMAKPYRSLWI
jgi:hypothetical protein